MDPVTITAVGKAAASASEAVADTGKNLAVRLFGPLADHWGAELVERSKARSARKTQALLDRAAEKRPEGAGPVPPRVAYRAVEEAVLTDDELVVDYLSGVLAGSRSPTGRDDRGVVWTELIARMSALQLRCHFMIYRSFVEALHGTDVNLGVDRTKVRAVFNLEEFVPILLENDADMDLESAWNHVIWGLNRLDLIAFQAFGRVETLDISDSIPYKTVLIVEPTAAGVELYGWGAMGTSKLTLSNFGTDAIAVEPPTPVAPLEHVFFPGLAEVSDTPTQPAPSGSVVELPGL